MQRRGRKQRFGRELRGMGPSPARRRLDARVPCSHSLTTRGGRTHVAGLPRFVPHSLLPPPPARSPSASEDRHPTLVHRQADEAPLSGELAKTPLAEDLETEHAFDLAEHEPDGRFSHPGWQVPSLGREPALHRQRLCVCPSDARAVFSSVSAYQCSISCVSVDRFADLFSSMVLSAEM